MAVIFWPNLKQAWGLTEQEPFEYEDVPIEIFIEKEEPSEFSYRQQR